MLEFHTISGEITVRCTEIFSKKKVGMPSNKIDEKAKRKGNANIFFSFSFFSVTLKVNAKFEYQMKYIMMKFSDLLLHLLSSLM